MNMKMILTLSVISIVILACGDGDDNRIIASEPVDAHIITPGVGAAGIRLGSQLDEVIRLYGEPDGWYEVEHVITVHEWRDYGLSVFTVNLEDESSHVVYKIELTRPSIAKTAGGNGIGSTYLEVRKEFGPSISGRYGRDDDLLTYVDVRDGIVFEYPVVPPAYEITNVEWIAVKKHWTTDGFYDEFQ